MLRFSTKDFFKPNIGRSGRIMRAFIGLACVGGGIPAWHWQRWLAVALLAGGIFAFFEASRGWCAARACGIKTKL